MAQGSLAALVCRRGVGELQCWGMANTSKSKGIAIVSRGHATQELAVSVSLSRHISVFRSCPPVPIIVRSNAYFIHASATLLWVVSLPSWESHDTMSSQQQHIICTLVPNSQVSVWFDFFLLCQAFVRVLSGRFHGILRLDFFCKQISCIRF